MKKYRIYIYTSITLLLFYLILIVIIVPIIVKYGMILNLDSDIGMGKQEAEQMAVLSSENLINEGKKDLILSSIRKAIEGTDANNVYLSVVDWSGKIVSHPDVTQIGNIVNETSNAISSIENAITAVDLYEQIFNKKKGELKTNSEIIYLKPVLNSDWIILAHVNIENAHSRIKLFKEQLYTLFFILGLVIFLLMLLITRLLSSYYETLLDKKTERFEDGVLNLSKLNESLENYQKNLEVLNEAKKEEVPVKETDNKEASKTRLLTYIRNELVPIAIEDISYIYLENTVTYIVRKDGKRYIANDSLDQIYSSVDNKLFFRANRQFIVAIYAIDKILKYGNSALKIETNPVAEVDIIIGKNKASSFRQWLDM